MIASIWKVIKFIVVGTVTIIGVLLGLVVTLLAKGEEEVRDLKTNAPAMREEFEAEVSTAWQRAKARGLTLIDSRKSAA